MKRQVVFIVGEPGVGKTTAIRGALGLDDAELVRDGLAKWTRWPRGIGGYQVVAAGHYTGDPFDGADRVSYSGANECLDYWAEHYHDTAALTVLDGSRFGTKGSLEWMLRLAPEHQIRCLYFTSDAAAARREARAQRVGQTQDPTWIRGAATRAGNFYRYALNRTWAAEVAVPDGSDSAAWLRREFEQWLV